MSADFNYVKALRLFALRDVLKDTSEYRLRHIFRWYSERYNTRLVDVPSFPLEHILQNYFEVQFEEMDEEARQAELKFLLETEEERKEREKQESLEEASNKMFEMEVEAEAEKQKIEKPAQKALDFIKPTILPSRLPEPTLEARPLAPGAKIPPNISMKFVEPEELEKMLDGDLAEPEKM